MDGVRAQRNPLLRTPTHNYGTHFYRSATFVMADAKSLGIGQTEDWCNLQRTRQFTSYMCDVYRAAYGRNRMDFEMCSILLSPPETEAKIFAEVGHGAKAIYLYKYGPKGMKFTMHYGGRPGFLTTNVNDIVMPQVAFLRQM